jgi:cytochrome bd ubiquinol oxidase subunit II
VLGGDLGRGESAAGQPTQARSLLAALAPGLLPRLAIACLVAGIGFLTIADAAWAHTLGVLCLFAFIVVAFPAALPPDLRTGPLQEARDAVEGRGRRNGAASR